MKSRLVAAGLHLLASALVIFLSLCVIYFIWYPKPFYTLYSVFDAVKIVMSVDLLLGPFLTLVIFNELKSRKVLMRDIFIILVLQISALAWGMHITHKMRPLFLVFYEDTFYPVIKSDINLKELRANMSAPAIWQHPKTMYVKPLKGEEAIRLMQDITSGKVIKGEMHRPERYIPIDFQLDSEYRREMSKKSMSTDYLINSKTWKKGVEQLVMSQGGVIEDYLFFPVENGLFYSGLIVFAKQDFSFAGLVK